MPGAFIVILILKNIHINIQFRSAFMLNKSCKINNINNELISDMGHKAKDHIRLYNHNVVYHK